MSAYLNKPAELPLRFFCIQIVCLTWKEVRLKISITDVTLLDLVLYPHINYRTTNPTNTKCVQHIGFS